MKKNKVGNMGAMDMGQRRLLWEVVRDLKEVRRGAVWVSEGCGYLRKAFQVERTAGAEAPGRSIKTKQVWLEEIREGGMKKRPGGQIPRAS